MIKYLTYPEKLEEYQLYNFPSQGWYQKEFIDRAKQNKVSKGDFDRLGIKIKRTDLKMLIKTIGICSLKMQNNILVYNDSKAKLSILPNALGIRPEYLKNGDLLQIENSLQDKGSLPILV